MRSPIAALPGALLLLAACAEPEGPPPALALVCADETPFEAGRVERVAHLTVPPEIAPWDLKGSTRQVFEGPEGEPALRLNAKNNRRVRIPGRFAAGAFDRVAVRGAFRATHELFLSLLDAEGHEFRAPAARPDTSGGVQTILFDVPGLDRAGRVYDTLELRVRGPGGAFELHAVDLWRRPLATRLPGAGEPPARVLIGAQSRLARGLSTRSARVAELDVVAGHVLAFDVGQPAGLHDPGNALVLTVEVGAGGEVLREEVPLVAEDGRAVPWRAVRLDLGALAGERASVRVALRPASGDGEGLAALTTPTAYRPVADAPTVLLVTSDTHRADHLGSAGVVEVDTPNLDALAARGVRFEDCWSATNITAPSHASLLTALHPREHRLLDNLSRLTDDATTLAERFREAGYRTFAAVSVNMLGPDGAGLDQGFERTFAPETSTVDAEDTIAALAGWLPDAEGQPLFAWLHLYDAHYPYEPPAAFDRRYYPGGEDPFDPSRPAVDAPRTAMPQGLWELRDLEFPAAQYRAEVSYLDDALGGLLARPRFRSGIVAVTADHGEILASERQMYFNHAELYPETLHVPLILAWPGAPAGERVATPLDHLGLGRTLLDLAGLEQVEFPGRNLLDEPRDAGDRPRFALAAHGFSASVTYGRWHFALHLRSHTDSLPRKRVRHEVELYDREADPACVRDVASEHPEEVRRLRALLVDWLRSAPATGLSRARATTAEERAELAALGYLTDEPEVEETDWIDPDCDCERCLPYR